METRLWLNTGGAYLPGTWQMPAPPLGPPSLVIEEPLPDLPAMSQATPASSQPPAQAGQVYPYRHAVLLQQKRRMRSNEVHYIDHPLFGLVIKFTPVTAEELAAIALEQGQI